MTLITAPDADQIQSWLNELAVPFFVCEHCHGLHLSNLQMLDGVLDARLFVDHEGLLLTTELEIRPSLLFHVQADITRLSMNFAALKFFVDVNDESMPRLVVCNTLLTQAGINRAQFSNFLQITTEATSTVIQEANDQGWLLWPDDAAVDDKPQHNALH